MTKQAKGSGKTHTGVLRHFGYRLARTQKRSGLFHETEGGRYFENSEGYGVGLRSDGAWRHCDKDGKRKARGHRPGSLERHLARFHGSEACSSESSVTSGPQDGG
jgi:hypothetical protein